MESEPAKIDELEKPKLSSRRWIGLVIFWVLMAMLLIAYLTLPFAADGGRWSFILFLPVVICLSCWLAAFAGLGQSFFRWPIFVLATPALGWYSSYSFGGGDHSEWLTFVGSLALTVAVTTLVLRLWKGNIARIEPGQNEMTEGLRFSIKHLFIWTTVSAIFVAIMQAILKSSLGGGGGVGLLQIGLMAGSVAIMVVFNIWAMLGKRVTMWKMLMLIIVTFGCSLAAGWLLDSEFFWMSLIAQAGILTLLVPLRMSGLRFLKRT